MRQYSLHEFTARESHVGATKPFNLQACIYPICQQIGISYTTGADPAVPAGLRAIRRKIDSGFHASQGRTIDLGNAVHRDHMSGSRLPSDLNLV
jgi:hypothetical protein